jgi:hypothetical protein
MNTCNDDVNSCNMSVFNAKTSETNSKQSETDSYNYSENANSYAGDALKYRNTAQDYMNQAQTARDFVYAYAYGSADVSGSSALTCIDNVTASTLSAASSGFVDVSSASASASATHSHDSVIDAQRFAVDASNSAIDAQRFAIDASNSATEAIDAVNSINYDRITTIENKTVNMSVVAGDTFLTSNLHIGSVLSETLYIGANGSITQNNQNASTILNATYITSLSTSGNIIQANAAISNTLKNTNITGGLIADTLSTSGNITQTNTNIANSLQNTTIPHLTATNSINCGHYVLDDTGLYNNDTTSTVVIGGNSSIKQDLTVGGKIFTSSISCNSSDETSETGSITNQGTSVLWNRDGCSGKSYIINQRGGGDGIGGIDFQLYDGIGNYYKTPISIDTLGNVSIPSTTTNTLSCSALIQNLVSYDLSKFITSSSLTDSIVGLSNTWTGTNNFTTDGLLQNSIAYDLSLFALKTSIPTSLLGLTNTLTGTNNFNTNLPTSTSTLTPTFSSITTSALTLLGNITALNATITPTIMSFLSGVTSNIQNQINTLNTAVTGLIRYGEIIMYVGFIAPANYLLCDGNSYSRVGTYANLFSSIGTVYGYGTSTNETTFNVPNFQGSFLRGYGGIGSHLGGNLGTIQQDTMMNHTHSMTPYIQSGNTGYYGVTGGNVVVATSGNSNSSGATGALSENYTVSTETRPYNQSVNYYIRY